MENPSGMDLVSDQLSSMSNVRNDEIKRRATEENSIVYGQVSLFVRVFLN